MTFEEQWKRAKAKQPQMVKEAEAIDLVDLIEATIYAAIPDDYDGCYSDEAELELAVLKAELNKRLTEQFGKGLTDDYSYLLK